MKYDFKEVKKCRICKSKNISKFLDLGSMPIPNGFISKRDLAKREKKYELHCSFCVNCGLVQLSNVINPSIMFKNYVYIPSVSRVMMNNFSNLSYQAYKDCKLNKDSLVVDIGSNDGSLLTFFKNYGTRVLGIDPAKNLVSIANNRGIHSESKLFNFKNAKALRKKYGQADLITATNVVAHVDNLYDFFRGMSHLLNKNGTFISEFPYLVDLIKKNEFDTIYHEHLSYFSLKPWLKLIASFGFKLTDAQRIQIHGGSIRLTHQKSNAAINHKKNTEKFLLELEDNLEMSSKNTFDQFTTRVEDLKKNLMELLLRLKKRNKKIVGYGAAAKGNVLTNYFGIGPNILDYIVDSTSYKQGLFTPGMHIPVYGESRLLEDKPDYALVLAWNFVEEIMAKEKVFKKNGGKFIIPIPSLRVI